ncbi:MAG: hypothetical protein OXH23_09230 [bacterium]|nr:hypothetical protein [bacterium]
MPAGPTAAQGDVQQDVAQRCFEHHKFGAQPVDVAKSADRQTVLARLSWGYHDAIGCYLTLDDSSLATLRANAQSESTPKPTPDPTVNPTPEPTPILVSKAGTGTDIIAVVLTEGTHIFEIKATAATGYFGVTVSQAGSTCDFLVNEIIDNNGAWTGRKVLNVGGFANCEAGSAVVEVDAEAGARWAATIGSE